MSTSSVNLLISSDYTLTPDTPYYAWTQLLHILHRTNDQMITNKIQSFMVIGYGTLNFIITSVFHFATTVLNFKYWNALTYEVLTLL